MVERHLDNGVNIYAFGCRTDSAPFPEKNRIVRKLDKRLFQIPWGSSVFSYDEIKACKPVESGFKYDIGWVGSIWGRPGRGNRESWYNMMMPLLSIVDGPKLLAGMGTTVGPVNDDRHKIILKDSKLCPILNAPSWQIENGVQDRFWTVFTTGRFGVVDVDGIYHFFNEDEVVCATEPLDYIEKSLFYLKNISKI